MEVSQVQLLVISLCTLVLKALASPFESGVPQRHLLATDDELTTTDIIIISVTCSAFAIAGIVGGVFVFLNRKKIFTSVSPAKTTTIQADIAEMQGFSDPGPSAATPPSNTPPPEGTSMLPTEDQPPQYDEVKDENTDVTVEAEVEKF